MMKIGFTRQFAILHLTRTQDEDDLDPDDMENYTEMTNLELEAELCLSGWIHDDDMAGVFDVLPNDVMDAKIAAQRGWPVTPS